MPFAAVPEFHDVNDEPAPGATCRYHQMRPRARKMKTKGMALGGPLSILTAGSERRCGCFGYIHGIDGNGNGEVAETSGKIIAR